MKKTAVLLYPIFCNYELSVALSALGQMGKPVAFFSAEKTVVRSEEQLPVLCDYTFDDLGDIDEYDSLLLTGCLDPAQSFMLDPRYYDFVRRFDRPDIVIGAISSAPILLSMSGVLRDRKYTCGVPEEIFEEVKLGPATYVPRATYVEDGNLLTAYGSQYAAFGLRFAEMLGLEADGRWYGVV